MEIDEYLQVQEFADTVFVLSTDFKFSITSWGRTVDHNKAVGGVANSRHVEFLAVDCVLDDPTQKDAFMEAAVKAELQALDDKDHVHLQWPRDGQGPGIIKGE
jgi:Peptidase M15